MRKRKLPLLLLRICIFVPFLLFPLEKLWGNFVVDVPKFNSPPKIDGILENPLWEKGAIIEDFTQFEPQEGAPPTERTKAYLGYDKDNFYIALHCFDSSPQSVRACLAPRDSTSGDDEVTIYLDTFNDKKRSFVFQVNPCGIQTDGVFTEESRFRRRRGYERFDKSWDTFYRADARRDETGYTIEIAIPFKSLRFPNTPVQRWGVKIVRTIRRKNEEIHWPPHSRDVNGFLVQAGTLEINGPIGKGKNIEIMPFITGYKEPTAGFKPEAGFNFKWGVTSDITADATYNPDFSQVEADMPQIDVNQRYPLYYPEKRPFFLEGKDYFDTPIELIYTRKVVNPQWGAKLTGKSKGFTLGFMSSLDESPPYIRLEEDPDADDEEEDDIYPGKALVSVLRLRKDIFSESYIGLVFTDKELGSSWESISDNFNRVAGVDGHFKFWDYNRLTFQAVGSVTKLGQEKTGLIPAYTLGVNHNSRHLSFSADWISIPPDFEAALGFLRRKDIRFLTTRAGYAFLPQNELIVSVRPSVEYRRGYDFSDTLTDEEYGASLFVSGWRQSHLWIRYTAGLERYNEVDFKVNEFRVSLGSEPFSWLSGSFDYEFGDSIYYEDNPYLGYKTGFEGRIVLRPLPNLNLSYNFENNQFYKNKGGEEVYKINIISQRINYQVSKPLSLRLITDYDDYDKNLYTSFLLSYEYRPGTVFYVGVDNIFLEDETGALRSSGQYYFIKFSYWWRI